VLGRAQRLPGAEAPPAAKKPEETPPATEKKEEEQPSDEDEKPFQLKPPELHR